MYIYIYMYTEIDRHMWTDIWSIATAARGAKRTRL